MNTISFRRLAFGLSLFSTAGLAVPQTPQATTPLKTTQAAPSQDTNQHRSEYDTTVYAGPAGHPDSEYQKEKHPNGGQFVYVMQRNYGIVITENVNHHQRISDSVDNVIYKSYTAEKLTVEQLQKDFPASKFTANDVKKAQAVLVAMQKDFDNGTIKLADMPNAGNLINTLDQGGLLDSSLSRSPAAAKLFDKTIDLMKKLDFKYQGPGWGRIMRQEIIDKATDGPAGGPGF